MASKLNEHPATASLGKILQSIQEHGYVIVHDALTHTELARLRAEVQPHLDAAPLSGSEFSGANSKRFGALLARVPITREMALNPLAFDVAQQLLGPSCARIQLNITHLLNVGPGESAQVMHRDTGFYPIQNPCPPLLLSTIWAMDDFTAANGATCLVPGSHQWPDSRKPLPQEIVQAEMPAGSLLMYIGALLHGGGANRTSASRSGVALHYSLAWLRQEENQYLAVPQTLTKTFPQPLQELMGYDLATVNLGFVDRQHPLDYLNDTAPEHARSLGPPELMQRDNAIERLHVDRVATVGRARFIVTIDDDNAS